MTLGGLTEDGGWDNAIILRAWGLSRANRGSFSEEIISNALQITKHLIIAESVQN
jgi:hypothetical protein